MTRVALGPLFPLLTLPALLLGCATEGERTATPAPSASATAAPPTPPPVPAPTGCKVARGTTADLATVTGDVHGLAGDGTHLYYSTWEAYGARGDVGRIRKDGGGSEKLTSLSLEPRELVLDGDQVWFTEGIRLKRIPRAGGEVTTAEDVFPSADLLLVGDALLGVPGEYGPYDRVARRKRTGGDPEEVVTGKRATKSPGPTGWNRLVADAEGIVVADASGDRLLALPLAGGKTRPLATGLDRAYELALVPEGIVVALARKGRLLLVPRGGGKAKQLASGLVALAQVAADGAGVYTVLAGAEDGAPATLARIPLDGGAPATVASIPGRREVTALRLDADCVYWAERESAVKSFVRAAGR